MLGELFVWLLQRINGIIEVMKKFDLGGGLNYFSLLFCLVAVSILYELLKHIRGEQLSRERFVGNMMRYDEEKERNKVNDKLRIMEERSQNK